MRVEPNEVYVLHGDDWQQIISVNVYKWWHMMTFDVLTDLTFGKPVGALQHGELCRFSPLWFPYSGPSSCPLFFDDIVESVADMVVVISYIYV